MVSISLKAKVLPPFGIGKEPVHGNAARPAVTLNRRTDKSASDWKSEDGYDRDRC